MAISPSPLFSGEDMKKTSTLGTIWDFAIWVVTLGGFLTNIFRMSPNGQVKLEEITLYSVDPAFFIWPIIVFGFIGSFSTNHFPASAGFWGWVWVFTIIYIFIAILTNLNIGKLLLWGVIFGFITIEVYGSPTPYPSAFTDLYSPSES